MESFQKRERERRKLEKRRDKADRKAKRDNPPPDSKPEAESSDGPPTRVATRRRSAPANVAPAPRAREGES
jgi:hypothetical protein